MPLFFADLVPGSGTYLYQETLYRSESCTGFVKLYAALSIGSADSLALAGGRSHDANPNNHAFVHGINIHGNHKCL